MSMSIVGRLKRLFPGESSRPATKMVMSTHLSAAAAQLDTVPRYTHGEIDFLGRKLRFTDSTSTKFIIGEIFDQGIYEFKPASEVPYILDCGANIGLSILYFKRKFPGAEIIGFEPDSKVFEVLTDNVETYNLQGVTLYPKALWNIDTVLKFYSEGADAGRLEAGQNATEIAVEAVRLSPYINKTVDFLKIDIEGAELEVLEECIDVLHRVQRIFVEYHSFVGKPQRLSRLVKILEEAGFRLSINAPGLVSSKPFVHITEYNGMDLQLNIYAYRQ